ncbi:unknown [Alistipes sp. CAG:831]|nr:unknown [Alistipes sp. CAG:831]
MRDGTESISMAITGSALNSEGKIKGFCDKISRAAI